MRLRGARIAGATPTFKGIGWAWTPSTAVMQSNTLIIKCFNNGATVQLHLRFELLERGLMIETATLPDGSPVSTIVLHKVSTN